MKNNTKKKVSLIDVIVESKIKTKMNKNMHVSIEPRRQFRQRRIQNIKNTHTHITFINY